MRCWQTVLYLLRASLITRHRNFLVGRDGGFHLNMHSFSDELGKSTASSNLLALTRTIRNLPGVALDRLLTILG